MNFRIFDTAEELARGTAEAIVRRIEHDGARIIALSGGSTPRPIYKLLGSGDLRDRISEFDIVWVIGDERFVPKGDADSNLRMVEETLLASGLPAGHRVLSFDTSSPDAEAAASNFEVEWRELGVPQLDLAVLGVGDDGHTASLFPGTTALDDTERVAVEVFVPKLDAWRLTLSLQQLRDAKARFIVAVGEKKKEILQRVAENDDLPIVRVTRDTDQTWWFVDRAARP